MNLENTDAVDEKENFQVLDKKLTELVNGGGWKAYLNSSVHVIYYIYRYFSTDAKLKGTDAIASGPVSRYLNVPIKFAAFIHDGLENRKMTRWIDETFQ